MFIDNLLIIFDAGKTAAEVAEQLCWEVGLKRICILCICICFAFPIAPLKYLH